MSVWNTMTFNRQYLRVAFDALAEAMPDGITLDEWSEVTGFPKVKIQRHKEWIRRCLDQPEETRSVCDMAQVYLGLNEPAVLPYLISRGRVYKLKFVEDREVIEYYERRLRNQFTMSSRDLRGLERLERSPIENVRLSAELLRQRLRTQVRLLAPHEDEVRTA